MKEVMATAIQMRKNRESVGNGKAVYMGDMNEEEYQDYEHNEVLGWKKIYKKYINNI